MHGAILAEDVSVTNSQIAAAGPVELQVLRLMPDHRAHVDLVVASDFRMPGDVRVCPNPRSRADLHVFFDDNVRADLDGRIDLRLLAFTIAVE